MGPLAVNIRTECLLLALKIYALVIKSRSGHEAVTVPLLEGRKISMNRKLSSDFHEHSCPKPNLVRPETDLALAW